MYQPWDDIMIPMGDLTGIMKTGSIPRRDDTRGCHSDPQISSGKKNRGMMMFYIISTKKKYDIYIYILIYIYIITVIGT